MWQTIMLLAFTLVISGCVTVESLREEREAQQREREAQQRERDITSYIQRCEDVQLLEKIDACKPLQYYPDSYRAQEAFKAYQEAIKSPPLDAKLLIAIKNKDFELAKKAINEGANVNGIFTYSNGIQTSCLHLALLSPHVNMTELLLDAGADPNLKYIQEVGKPARRFPIYQCRFKGDEKQLLEHGYKVDFDTLKAAHALNNLHDGRNFSSERESLLVSYAPKDVLDKFNKLLKPERDRQKAMSNPRNIGKKVCSSGTISYSCPATLIIAGIPFPNREEQSAQAIAYLEGSVKNGKRIKVRTHSFSSKYGVQCNPTSSISFSSTKSFIPTTEANQVYWVNSVDWNFCD